MKQAKTVDLYSIDGAALHNQPETMPWNDYPRPQLRRNSFVCLNGWWDFAVTDGCAPTSYQETIRVPFPPESLLSGIHRVSPKGSTLYYRRYFTLPMDFNRGRVILHIGAADQSAQIWVNNRLLATHDGGYLPFSVDITDTLQQENSILIAVKDELHTKMLPYGKQRYDRGGMWYTPVSGLWQTVWLESVPQEYIQGLKIDVTETMASIHVLGIQSGTITVQTPSGDVACKIKDGVAVFKPEQPRCWSPDDPYLYEFTASCGEDTVSSYFALRTVSVRCIDGIPRICLNGQPIFLHALLDQGYWSDGLFLPAKPGGYDDDVLFAKTLGYNTLRKHIKIEPEQFYYACDRHGIIVWQDMVNNGEYSFIRDTALPTIGLKRLNDKRLHRQQPSREAFERAMVDTVTHLRNHPCIIGWTIFNEGWGQFDSARLYRRLHELDGSRLIDSASGWFTADETDVISPHVYFKPVRIKAGTKPIFLSEFGGYSYKIDEHSFTVGKAFGYRFFTEKQVFDEALINLYEREIVPAIANGLCGAVYTQLSDVEDETNGLITYDRRIHKVNVAHMQSLAKKVTI